MPKQAPSCDLRQGAGLDQALHHTLIRLDLGVSFRVRDDGRNAFLFELCEHIKDIERDRLERQFQKDVFLVIVDRQSKALLNVIDQVLVDADLVAREDVDGNLILFELGLGLCGSR